MPVPRLPGWIVGTVAVLPAVLVACTDASPPGSAERVMVLSTVAPLTSIVAAIAGDRVDVVGIVPETADPRTYRPAPSTIQAAAEADVVFANGLGLDEVTIDLLEGQLPEEAEVVRVANLSIAESDYLYEGGVDDDKRIVNAFAWTDPVLAGRYATIVANALSGLDPPDAEYFGRNLEQFAGSVKGLDEAVRGDLAEVGKSRRTLLSDQPGLAYLARQYDLEVVWADAAGGVSGDQRVTDLVDRIRHDGVRAVVGSGADTGLQAAARSAGLPYLEMAAMSDLPGLAGDPTHSWYSLERTQARGVVGVLGARGSQLDRLAPFPLGDQAAYPA